MATTRGLPSPGRSEGYRTWRERAAASIGLGVGALASRAAVGAAAAGPASQGKQDGRRRVAQRSADTDTQARRVRTPGSARACAAHGRPPDDDHLPSLSLPVSLLRRPTVSLHHTRMHGASSRELCPSPPAPARVGAARRSRAARRVQGIDRPRGDAALLPPRVVMGSAWTDQTVMSRSAERPGAVPWRSEAAPARTARTDAATL
jgi:hypothetical protein